jgi:hypothetical protein
MPKWEVTIQMLVTNKYVVELPVHPWDMDWRPGIDDEPVTDSEITDITKVRKIQ